MVQLKIAKTSSYINNLKNRQLKVKNAKIKVLSIKIISK